MRTLTNFGLLVGGVAISTFGLASCSASHRHTVVETPITTTHGSPSSGSAVTTTTRPAPKHVRDTVSLPASVESPRAQITLVRVVDPAHGANQLTNPDPGSRFVAVQFRIVLGGTNFVSASPSNDATVYDYQGQSYASTFSSLQSCQKFAPGLVISPGEAVLGCVTFQIPMGAKVAKVKFTPASRFANNTAEWNVP